MAHMWTFGVNDCIASRSLHKADGRWWMESAQY